MRSIFQNKLLTIIIILLLVANLGLLVYYSFFKDSHSRDKKKPVTEFVKQKLEFDEQQMKTFEDTKVKNKARLKQLFDESYAAKDSFYQLVLIDNLDDSLLFDRALVVADKQRAIELELFRQFKGIQAMCKPGQLVRFDAGFMEMVQKIYRKPEDRDSSKNR